MKSSTPDAEAPSVPTGLAAAVVSASQVDLTWSASTDNVAVTEYTVLRDGVAVATTATTSYSDVGLTPATTYAYTVTAGDAAGNVSAPSTPPVSATTSSTPDAEAPSVPTGLAAAVVSSSQVDLTWNASTDNVAVTEYTVLREGVAVATTTTTSYSEVGRTPATTYAYTVTAANVLEAGPEKVVLDRGGAKITFLRP